MIKYSCLHNQYSNKKISNYNCKHLLTSFLQRRGATASLTKINHLQDLPVDQNYLSRTKRPTWPAPTLLTEISKRGCRISIRTEERQTEQYFVCSKIQRHISAAASRPEKHKMSSSSWLFFIS
jgi:hypothetical protein